MHEDFQKQTPLNVCAILQQIKEWKDWTNKKVDF